MSSHVISADITDYEIAMINDPGHAEFVLRRKGPAILMRLSHRARKAVETYVIAVETVAAGGIPTSNIGFSCGYTGSAPAREGRQAGAVDQVAFLRKLETAVGKNSILVGRRNPVKIPEMEIWREICLGDFSLVQVLAKRNLSRSQPKKDAISSAFSDTAERVACVISDIRSPL